jgi:hypothetical protein
MKLFAKKTMHEGWKEDERTFVKRCTFPFKKTTRDFEISPFALNSMLMTLSDSESLAVTSISSDCPTFSL